MALLPPVVESVIDLEKLVQPLSAELPAGIDLRYENVPTGNRRNPKYWHDAIKEAATEDLLAWEDPRYADWGTVISLCTAALAAHSKDLQIAAWLVEAHVNLNSQDQLAGLRDGLKLLRGLLVNYWETLYPLSDPENLDGHFTARANVLERLQNNLALAVKRIPLTQGETGLRYSYNQYESSKAYVVTGLDEDALTALRERLKTDNERSSTTELRITDEDWVKAHQLTSHAHYAGRLQVLNESVEALKVFDEVMDQQFQRETPGLRNLMDAVDEVQRLARVLASEKHPAGSITKTNAATEVVTSTHDHNLTSASAGLGAWSGLLVPAGALRNRQEALQRLSEVATYFRQTEPHTPVALLVERAVHWGNLPFEKLLVELIKDSVELGRLRDLLGLPTETIAPE